MRIRKFALVLALILMGMVPAQAVQSQVYPDGEAQAHNALLAAEAINQTVLETGESFSFNEAVGARTEARGYVRAANGRGAEVIGGGVGQAASALYLALCQLEPGMVVFDELSVYGDRYAGSYVSDGSQAVLVDFVSGRDFRFTNCSGGLLSISMKEEDGVLLCAAVVQDRESLDQFGVPEATYAREDMRWLCTVQLECGSDPGVLRNVDRAAGSIYDYTLESGEVFSFNDVVGPRTERYGYVTGINGRGAEVIGGGVGQVASALWLMVKSNPDFYAVEKATYGSRYNQSYVSGSSDAILVDYSAGTDFSFGYSGPGCIMLYPYLDETTLVLNVYAH